MTVSKRGLLGGAVGGLIAAGSNTGPVQERARGPDYPPPAAPDNYKYTEALNRIGAPDPMSAIKLLWSKQAQEAAELERRILDNKLYALNDLKSTSEAYKRYRYGELRREQDAVRNRLDEFLRRVCGW